MRAFSSSILALALHSYAADLRKWIAGMAAGYAMAVGLMLAGAIALLLAIGVGIAAAFHGIEVRYGVSVAYAAIGGFFLALGLAGLLAGRALLKRPVPSIPRPRRQAELLKRSIAAPAAIRLISNIRPGGGGTADPVTQLLAATAAITLIGWIVVSRFGRKDAARD